MRYLSAVLATVLVLTASGAQALMMDVFSLEPMHGKSKRCSLVPQQPALAVLPVQQSYSAAIGSTQRSTFTVSNTGNAAATGLVFDNFSSPAFTHASSATNPCGTTLAAKASCNKDVLYTGTSGTQAGTLVIESDQYPPTGYAALTGTGKSIAIVSLEFEPGEDHTGWTSAGSTLPITNSTANILRGTQSLRLTDTGTDATFTSPTFTAQSTIHAAFMVSFTNVSTTTTANFFQFFNGSTSVAQIFLINGNIAIGIGTKTSPAYAVTSGVMYYIWLDYIAGTGANGVAAYYISTTGIKPTTATYTITNGESTLSVNNIRFTGRHSANPNSYDFDHVLVQPSVIGDRN